MNVLIALSFGHVLAYKYNTEWLRGKYGDPDLRIFNSSEPVLSSFHIICILQSTNTVFTHAPGCNLMEITYSHGGDVTTSSIYEFIISGDDGITDDLKRFWKVDRYSWRWRIALLGCWFSM